MSREKVADLLVIEGGQEGKAGSGRLPQRPPGELRVMSLEELLSSATIQPRAMIMAPWLRERHLALLYAPSGLGKSLLALTVALAVAGGGSVPGLAREPVERPRRVLYVDGEMDTPDIQQRAGMLLGCGVPGVDRVEAGRNLSILARMGQPPGSIAGEGGVSGFPNLTEEAGQQVLLDLVDSLGAELVILDNLSTLATVEDENEASAFNPLVGLLVEMKNRGTAVLVVHHSRKANQGEGSYRGSQKLSVIFNTILRLEKPKQPTPGAGAEFVVHWEKYRELRDDSTSIPLVMKLGEAGWVAQVDEDERMMALVRELRSFRHTSVAAAGRALGIPRTTAKRLKDKAIALGILSLGELKALLDAAKELASGPSDDPEEPEESDEWWEDQESELAHSPVNASTTARQGATSAAT